jgi:hypothetical protein
MVSYYSAITVLEWCHIVGLRLQLAPYAMLDTVVLIGRRSWWLLFQGSSSQLRASQAWWVEASRASPDLPSNSRRATTVIEMGRQRQAGSRGGGEGSAQPACEGGHQ